MPAPRIAVFQDLDADASGASIIGEVHAAILKAFQCEGVITNGSVRDIPAVSRMEFPMFARAASVSHAYMHIVDFGTPVEIFGLPVKSGDLDLSRGLVLTAEFKPYQEVDVMAKVSGYIKEINVDVGDRVKQGQLLATLEIPEMTDDLRRADAAVVRAKAEVTRAQDEQRRAESVHSIAHLSFQRLSTVAEKKPGLVAQQEIDEAQSRDLVTEAQVAAAKSALVAAQEQVNVNSADTQKVLAIPAIAVDRDNSDAQPGAAQTGQVLVVTPNNCVERRKVTLGIESSNNIEIRSGLNEGDSVVLTGRSTLRPGQEVRPKVTSMAAPPL